MRINSVLLATLAVCAIACAPAGAVSFVEFTLPHQPAPGIAAGPDGAIWYGQAGGGVARLSTGGVVSGEFAIPGSNPDAIVAGPDGAMWVVDNSTIDRVPLVGSPVTATTTGFPIGIAVGPDGALWATEVGNNKIDRLTTGGVLTQYPTLTAGETVGITAGPDGNLWFTEATADRIGTITTAGSVSEFAVPTTNSQPFGIAAGPDGALWFTESNADKLGRITTTGTLSEFAIPSLNTRPARMVAGPDGALWFVDQRTGGSIGRVQPTGGVPTISMYPIPTAADQPEDLAVGPDGNIWFTEGGPSPKMGVLIPTVPPVVSTGSASALATSSATLAGSVRPRGAATSYLFQYGTDTSYGASSVIADAGSDDATHAVATNLANLAPGTLYHFRIVAFNANGASYGLDGTFDTAPAPPPPLSPLSPLSPPGSGLTPGPATASGPTCKLSAPSSQAKLASKGTLGLSIICDRDVAATAAGALKVGSRSYQLAGKRTRVTALTVSSLSVSLSKSGLTALRKILLRHPKLSATLSAVAVAASGGPSSTTRASVARLSAPAAKHR